jgi:hypothetical protein
MRRRLNRSCLRRAQSSPKIPWGAGCVKTPKFAGMTLDQFTQAIMPSETARVTIARLENELSAAQNQRDNADTAGLALALRVVNTEKADAEEGEL